MAIAVDIAGSTLAVRCFWTFVVPFPILAFFAFFNSKALILHPTFYKIFKNVKIKYARFLKGTHSVSKRTYRVTCSTSTSTFWHACMYSAFLKLCFALNVAIGNRLVKLPKRKTRSVEPAASYNSPLGSKCCKQIVKYRWCVKRRK